MSVQTDAIFFDEGAGQVYKVVLHDAATTISQSGSDNATSQSGSDNAASQSNLNLSWVKLMLGWVLIRVV